MIVCRRKLTAASVLVCLLLASCAWGQAPVDAVDARTPVPLSITMAEDVLDDLYARDPFSSHRLPGAFRTSLDGSWTDLPTQSIRFRGTSSRLLPKKSFSVDLANPEPFAFGTPHLNLIAMWTDPSFMRAALAFDMFRALGLIASRAGFIDLYLNDVYEGLYLAVQRVDGDLLASYGFTLDGSSLVRDAFRASRPGGAASMFSYDWSGETDPLARLQASVDARGTPDWEALWDLVQWVHDTPAGPSFATGFEARIDVESFIDWLAVHVLIADIDSFADDYWLFLDGSNPDAKWQFIPWDKDLSFGSHWVDDVGVANDFLHLEFTPYAGWYNALVHRFLDTDALYERFAARMDALMHEVLTVERMAAEVSDIAARIAASVNRGPGPNAFQRHPANHFGDLGFFEQHTEAIVSFVERRYAFLERTLLPPAPDAVPYAASVDVPRDLVGGRLLLTDDLGWTIARLDVRQVEGAAPSVNVRVEQDARFETIDRTWALDVQGGSVEADLTLYYRNNPVEGNWYRVGDETVQAIGGQRSLRFAEVFEGAESSALDLEIVPSRVNPYVNAVTTTVPLELSGSRVFALVDERTRR